MYDIRAKCCWKRYYDRHVPREIPRKNIKLPSYTTRPKREKEKEGLDYFFVTLEKFDEMKKKESYLEFRNIMVINMPQIKINYMKPLKIKVK